MTLKSTYMDHRNGGSSAAAAQQMQDDSQCHSYMGRISATRATCQKIRSSKSTGPTAAVTTTRTHSTSKLRASA